MNTLQQRNMIRQTQTAVLVMESFSKSSGGWYGFSNDTPVTRLYRKHHQFQTVPYQNNSQRRISIFQTRPRLSHQTTIP